MISISLIPNFKWKYLLPAKDPGGFLWLENGRTALYFLLKSLKVEGGEVVIQAFTCSVVPGAIIEAGAKPVYCDIDDTYNLDPEKLRITDKTKAVIIQHTFGTPANYSTIKAICDRNNVPLIEDCAHFPKPFGDLYFYSFGRDKSIAAIFGGALKKQNIPNLPARNILWNLKQYCYLFLTWFVIQTYDFFGFGKALHFVIKKVNPPITDAEKRGEKHKIYYRDFPLKNLVVNQLNDLDNIIAHRRQLAKIYCEELNLPFNPKSTYLRYTIEVDDPDGLRKFAARQNIFLGDWYDKVVAPKSVDPKIFKYQTGSCPVAERAAKRAVNLPTNLNLTEQDVLKVVNIVKEWKKTGMTK